MDVKPEPFSRILTEGSQAASAPFLAKENNSKNKQATTTKKLLDIFMPPPLFDNSIPGFFCYGYRHIFPINGLIGC
jgi:hypothetical protein